MVGCASVAAEHDVLHAGQTGQRFDVGVVRLHGERIGEEEQIVDIPLHDAGAHLLVSAQRAALANREVPVYIRMLGFESLKYQCAGRTGAEEFMTDEALGVPEYPFYQILFLGIVSYKSDAAYYFWLGVFHRF